jgi:hypothetical protein
MKPDIEALHRWYTSTYNDSTGNHNIVIDATNMPKIYKNIIVR